MISRTTSTLAAFLFVSIPWGAALAQPAPATDKPLAPGSDKAPAADEAPAADKAAPPDRAAPVEPDQGHHTGSPSEKKPGSAAPTTGEADPDLGAFARPISLSSEGFRIWPVVLIQTQLTPYIGTNASYLAGDIAERPGFRLRRARFGFGGAYRSLVELWIAGELSTATDASMTLTAASLGLTPKPYFGAYMGVIDVPFSRSMIGFSSDTALIDRPLAVRAMAPSGQMGGLVAGSVAQGRFHYQLGVFNGFQRSDLFYSGYRTSLAALGNRFDNLAYAARIASSLDTPGSDIPLPRDFKNRFNVGASYFFSDGGARDIHSAEGDLLFQRGGFRLLAEVLYSKTIPESVPTQPTTQTATIDSLGVVAEGGYTLFRTVSGNLRFEWIDPNMVVDDATDNWLLTVGASVAPPSIEKFVRIQLEFTHREEVHGKSLDNDSLTLQTQLVLQ